MNVYVNKINSLRALINVVCTQGQSRVIALLNDPIRDEDSIKIMVDKKGEVINIPSFKKRNPYTIQFDIPGNFIYLLLFYNRTFSP